MSYRRTWSRTLYSDEFDVTAQFPKVAPTKCNQHVDSVTGRPLCFVASATPSACGGWWVLREKLDILSVMPGTNQKIIGLTSKGLYEIGFGTVIDRMLADVKLKGDGAEIWKSPGLAHDQNKWVNNIFNPNRDIAGHTTLDIELYQSASVITGGVHMHDAELILQCEYYTDIPPEKADVRIDVMNKETGELVKQAYVALMSGAVVEADGYTDGGTITFNNINEGGYTVKIMASGYHVFNMAIEVEAPSVWYNAEIVPIPVEPWPWWVLPLAISTGVVFGVMILRRKPQPPIMVVR